MELNSWLRSCNTSEKLSTTDMSSDAGSLGCCTSWTKLREAASRPQVVFSHLSYSGRQIKTSHHLSKNSCHFRALFVERLPPNALTCSWRRHALHLGSSTQVSRCSLAHTSHFTFHTSHFTLHTLHFTLYRSRAKINRSRAKINRSRAKINKVYDCETQPQKL